MLVINPLNYASKNIRTYTNYHMSQIVNKHMVSSGGIKESYFATIILPRAL